MKQRTAIETLELVREALQAACSRYKEGWAPEGKL